MNKEIFMTLLGKLNDAYKIDGLDLSAINLNISPEDTMWTNAEHYFSVGFSSLQCILQALNNTQRERYEIKTILDFPSGWGRVLRFIKAYFPQSQITACELDENALKFCGDQLKVNTLMSHEDFSEIKIEKKFDLIWCGSLITHLSEDRTKKLLKFFFNTLNDKGILVFTSHGRYSRKLLIHKEKDYGLSEDQILDLLRQYETIGYGYVDYDEGIDYGISLARPSKILQLLEEAENFKVIGYNERLWDNHQDVIACVKEPLTDEGWQEQSRLIKRRYYHNLETHAANLEQLLTSKEAHIANLEQLVASKEAQATSLEQELETIERTKIWQLALKWYAFKRFLVRSK